MINPASNESAIIWVQKLGIFVILSFAFRSFFTKVIVYYDEEVVSPFLERFLRILDQFGFSRVFQKSFLNSGRSDMGKLSPFYRIRDEVDQCLEDICHQYGLAGDIRLKNMVKCYLYDSVGLRISFINMVREKIDAKGMSKEAQHKIYIHRHTLNVFIKRFYERQGLVIKESGIVGGNVGIILRLFKYFTKILYGKFVYRGIFTNIKEVKPSVWVEYNGVQFDFCFWQDGVDRDKAEIVNFLFRNDYPKNITQIMEEGENKWVDGHFLPVLRMSGISLNQIAGIMKHLLRDINDYPLILAYLFFLDHVHYLIYTAVFKKFLCRGNRK